MKFQIRLKNVCFECQKSSTKVNMVLNMVVAITILNKFEQNPLNIGQYIICCLDVDNFNNELWRNTILKLFDPYFFTSICGYFVPCISRNLLQDNHISIYLTCCTQDSWSGDFLVWQLIIFSYARFNGNCFCEILPALEVLPVIMEAVNFIYSETCNMDCSSKWKDTMMIIA